MGLEPYTNFQIEQAKNFIHRYGLGITPCVFDYVLSDNCETCSFCTKLRDNEDWQIYCFPLDGVFDDMGIK